MELPKFLLADNSQFPEDVFVIHLDYPRFILNLKDDQVEFLEDISQESDNDLEEEMQGLIELAITFYDKEVGQYD